MGLPLIARLQEEVTELHAAMSDNEASGQAEGSRRLR
jgi:hypothetical protein